MTGELLYLTSAAGYLVAASSVAWLIWHLTGGGRFVPIVRGLFRTVALAILFAPTLFACGAYAPMPFLVLAASDVFLPNYACSPHHSLVIWNAQYILAPT